MKLNMNDLKNITPVGEEITLKYETNYNGEESELVIKVYPLTVEEKIDLQKKSDTLGALLKIKETTPEQTAEITRLNDEINLDYAFFTMRKISDDVTREFVKDNFPKKWYMQIFRATLKAEGISTKDIDAEKN